MTANPGPAPTPRCTTHIGAGASRCGACMDDRIERDDWTYRKRLHDAERARIERDALIHLRALEIAACTRCDDDGRAPNGMPCSHVTPARMPASLRQLITDTARVFDVPESQAADAIDKALTGPSVPLAAHGEIGAAGALND